MKDVAGRLSGRVQLITNKLGACLNAVQYALGDDIDYAQLIKKYGSTPEGE